MAVKKTTMKPGRRMRSLISQEDLANAKAYFHANNLLVDPPVKRAAYSDRMAWVLASMAQLAYERFEDGGSVRELLLEKLKGGGFKLINTFNATETDTQAFLVAKDDMSYAVLAFRGTEVTKSKDIITDATARMVSAISGRVHQGFIHAYQSVEKDIEKSIAKLGEDVPLYITGHSLGAALATLATQRLEQNMAFRDQIAACYTFGSPRVGNTEFDKDFKSSIYRVVNTTDIVTVVPLLVMGYVHIGDVRFLEPDMGDVRRGIPITQRIFFFLMTSLRWFGPLVGDHAITEYRRKLEAVAQDRNLDLYVDISSIGKS